MPALYKRLLHFGVTIAVTLISIKKCEIYRPVSSCAFRYLLVRFDKQGQLDDLRGVVSDMYRQQLR